MVRETVLLPEDFVCPIFLINGKGIKQEIETLAGQYHYSIDMLQDEIKEIQSLKIPAILLFGVVDDKDEIGSNAFDPNGLVQNGIKKIKEIAPHLTVITDVCLCQYTSHGHCGIIKDNCVDNDETLEILAKVALSHAQAGADIVAPSDMMDGRVGKIREVLDENGFQNTLIMSYSVKYASAFYGPFRGAANSSPSFGDRKTYQMDYSNAKEAIKEAEFDFQEGADILMVKPALAYQDIIYRIKQKFNIPIAAYSVSGEYVMIKSASLAGMIDEKKVVLETLTGIKRAGADIIITYYAKEASKWINEG
jgi:porphobilinogen synthase